MSCYHGIVMKAKILKLGGGANASIFDESGKCANTLAQKNMFRLPTVVFGFIFYAPGYVMYCLCFMNKERNNKVKNVDNKR